MRYQKLIEIDAPADTVWEVMADVAHWPEWTASVSSVAAVDGGGMAVGGRWRMKQPRLAPMTWRITAVQPQRSFTWEASNPGVHTTATHCVEAQAGGRVRAELTIEQRGFLAPLIGALYGGLTRRYVDTEAHGLKQRSEALAASRG